MSGRLTDPTPHPDPAVALTADEARQAIIESLSWRESLGVGRWGHEVATAILDDYLAARTADAAARLAAVRAREVADLLAVHRLYGEDGDDYYECGCGEWTPADCMERDFGDLLWHEDHVASLIAALSTAPDAGQREAQERAEGFDRALAVVCSGVENAQAGWRDRMSADKAARPVISALGGLRDAIARTENPYRADRSPEQP